MAPKDSGIPRGGTRGSEKPLRSETARLLNRAGRGVVKWIAAALAVKRSRVDRMHEGEDANYLELVARVLDRIVVEAGVGRVVPILRWIAERYGFGLFELAAPSSAPGPVDAAAVDVLEALVPVWPEVVAASAGREFNLDADRLTDVIEQVAELRAAIASARK